eukprot:5407214-Pleurochrysis_carterae.AAC.1
MLGVRGEDGAQTHELARVSSQTSIDARGLGTLAQQMEYAPTRKSDLTARLLGTSATADAAVRLKAQAGVLREA